MTARPGWPAVSGAATFQDIRRALAGQVVKSAAGVLRKGILPINTSPLVTGTATMNVAVGVFVAVLDRNGAVFLPNDGTVNVLLSSAPASGSRWSVVYVKQREMDAPFSDTVNGPIIDKVESTSSESLARAALPVGSLELAVVKVDAGSANTNATGVTITQTAPFTAMEGGVVLLRSQAEQDAWAPHDGSPAFRLDLYRHVLRIAGGWDEVDAIDVAIYGSGFGPYMASGWSGLRYWRRGRVVYVNGAILNDAAGNVAGEIAANIPLGFRPPVKWATSDPRIAIRADGEVELQAAVAGGAAVSFHTSYPLWTGS